ncbi:thiol peroxidase (lipid hydroperoxide reductase) [Candidatus Hydrogenisulfobacillus filiaventi]|uniref:Thiol peroxidase n=1 Tax=Candidatus Hydrogenisulfobacillus filiaventi TaxID=2707344 RepID=A0A6F8ZE54_9FIRM|nr:thiol peroxidase [Bacillota bacterium]CAB1128211.1 thiol peroxidase (lipid hydroperoxide reductase) [Candidatus Hydrogenisulfobacillus filiaventi]
MTPEREKAVTFKGRPLTLLGPRLEAGDAAPDFSLTRNDLSTATLADYAGQVLLLASVPSLDTPVCDQETRRFNQEAAALGPGVRILTISMDLPFAQARWCGAAGVDRVETLSDYKDRTFGYAYGVYIKELGLLARAVFVVDRNGRLAYVEYVPEVGQHPDYDAALAAVRRLQ